MKRNLMPRLGTNLETLGREVYYENKKIYITLEGFKKKIDEKEYDIISVELNDTFINEFLTNIFDMDLFSNSKYFSFNVQYGMKQTGSFSTYKSDLNENDIYIIES